MTVIQLRDFNKFVLGRDPYPEREEEYLLKVCPDSRSDSSWQVYTDKGETDCSRLGGWRECEKMRDSEQVRPRDGVGSGFERGTDPLHPTRDLSQTQTPEP